MVFDLKWLNDLAATGDVDEAKNKEVKKRLGTPHKNPFKYEYETVNKNMPTVTKQSEKQKKCTRDKEKEEETKSIRS